MIEVSAYRWVPPFAQGYVKDLRVRWALEEAGLAYEAAVIEGGDRKPAAYRKWQPFNQVPAYRDDAVEMFESGAIVLHIAEKSEALAPRDEAGRARASSWVFAALNSVEPFAQALIQFDAEGAPLEWAEKQRGRIAARLDARLAALVEWLGGKDYLEGRFTAGDLVMAMVLRELVDSGALKPHPALEGYLERCLARPAFGRALEAQMAIFREAERRRRASA